MLRPPIRYATCNSCIHFHAAEKRPGYVEYTPFCKNCPTQIGPNKWNTDGKTVSWILNCTAALGCPNYVKTNEDYVSKIKEGSKLCHLNHPEYEKLYHFTTDREFYQTEEGRRYCINLGFIPLGIKYKKADKTKVIEIKNKVNGEVVATYDMDTYESSVVSVLKG